MKILVTGAAGYIGSVVVELLIDQGHEVVVADDLSHGHRRAVHPEAAFERIDLSDASRVRAALRQHEPQAVVHLAAKALIDESVRDPGRFFQANTCGGLNLLQGMVEAGVEVLINSSTAAVYGQPDTIPIPETAPLLPVNSYGESKLAFERMLPWFERAHGLKHVSFRYMNACGATERFGEFHVPETHLIPALFEVVLGQRGEFELYGTDYETPDGTCIRDYVHVVDIARAHSLAIERIDRVSGKSFNLGNGNGFSNLEVIKAVGEVTGEAIDYKPASRRPGDPARLVASADLAYEHLGWQPEQSALHGMIESAWAWRLKHPYGYER